jgi:hypothetical protein
VWMKRRSEQDGHLRLGPLVEVEVEAGPRRQHRRLARVSMRENRQQ